MTEKTILVVDDEEDILNLIEYNLYKYNYKVICVASGEQALEEIQKSLPDLIVLDLMLPGIEGLKVCQAVRQNSKTKEVPIIMLTAKGEEIDVVRGLEYGADDYITKPFSPKILLARIRAVLRRKENNKTGNSEIVRIHEIEINPGRYQVTISGLPVNLTLTEFRILQFLSQRPGWVFTREQIIESVHGTNYPVTDRSVDVQIVGLRKKLGFQGQYIETVRGIGYRFKE